MDMNNMSGAMGGSDPDADNDNDSGGYAVTLYVGADGSMSVGVEQGTQPDPNAQPVKSLSDAMKSIMSAVENNGEVDAEENGFNEGYGDQGSADMSGSALRQGE